MTANLARSDQIAKELERPSRWERPALAAGILFVAVQIAAVAFNVAFFLTTHPPMDASPAATARGFAQAETMVGIGTYLYVLHVPFLLLFLGGLFGVLRRAEGGGGALAVSALDAGIAMVVFEYTDRDPVGERGSDARWRGGFVLVSCLQRRRRRRGRNRRGEVRGCLLAKRGSAALAKIASLRLKGTIESGYGIEMPLATRR
jgi:hypothetical protein